ncbi:MAG: hypothetical protein MUC49_19570 [Raineya sp.]|jgi:hypothetical protein|nr:hypothetical protein [Raineya sp.]
MEIYIAKPCSEKLENMIPDKEGYFCQHCAKKVIDFTQKTDSEIQTYMEEAESPVCGMFLKTQLNRPLKTSWQEKTLEKYFAVRLQKKKSLWNGVYAMGLYALLLLSGCKTDITAQNVEKTKQEQVLNKDTTNCVKDTVNSALMDFGEMPPDAQYPTGINGFRKTIQNLLWAKIPEKDRVNENTIVQFVVNKEGKIETIVFLKNPPTEYIQEIIKDILYNKVEKFSPALNHKGEPVKTRKSIPIKI